MRKLFLFGLMFVIGLVAMTACTSTPASKGLAQAPAGSFLRKIQDRGKLIVGTRSDTPTFCYLNPKTNQMEGFEVAISREIAGYIFGDPNLVEFKLIKSAERLPMVKDGSIDFTIATMTINDDRVKEIDFSVVYYIAGQRLLVLQDSAIKGLQDVDNKKVGVIKGSTPGANLKKVSKAQVVEFDNYDDAMKALQGKQIDAISTDDAILYGLQVNNAGTKVVGSQFSYEPYGIGLAKNSPELLNAVNTVVKNLKTSGKWKTLWTTEIGNKIGITIAPDAPADEWKR
jgi:putative glutamine transport system substrate-binding protein